MSVIDKVLQGREADSAAMSVREAAATILVAAIACDGTLTHEERVGLHDVLASMRLYREIPSEHLQHLVEAATNVVAQHGFDAVLPICAAAVPEHLREPLFALAVELVFVDDRVTEREKQFVDALQAALGINEQAAMKIVSVLLIKSRA